MYLQLEDHPPYSDKLSETFETNINKNLRCCHGYTNYSEKKQFITWISINTWENFHPEFT